MGVVLGNIIAIYRRELQSYFVSPLAYAIAGIFWLIAGLFLVMILLGPDGILVGVAAIDAQGQQLGVPVPPIDAHSLDGTLCRRTEAGHFRIISHVTNHQLGGSCR